MDFAADGGAEKRQQRATTKSNDKGLLRHAYGHRAAFSFCHFAIVGTLGRCQLI
jgi:hypothetical protein